MKAYVLNAVGKLDYKDIEQPLCPEGWVIVNVRAAGICSSDIPRIFTKGTYHFPTIPGHEFSGDVVSVGSKTDEKWIGKKVGVFPLIPCKQCEQCKLGHYEMCENYDYLGSRRDGGYAEKVAVPVWNLIELDDAISYEEGAMLEPLAVALHAMKQAGIKNGDRVAVIGTGMIGFATAKWAEKLGAAEALVVGRNESKRKIADAVGVKYQMFSEVTESFDVVLEAVGSNEAVDRAINLAKASGTIVLMGNPEGNIVLAQNTYWRILRKQLKLVGTWNSVYENNAKCDWTEVVECLEKHELDVGSLITQRFNQDNLHEGLEVMQMHQVPYCKVITLWNEE